MARKSPEENSGLSLAPSAGVGEHLDADGSKDHRAGRATRGAAVSLVSQGLKFTIGIVGTAVLARLLTPNDYGLIGMAAGRVEILETWLSGKRVCAR